MQIALKAPADFTPDAILATCRDLGVRTVEIAASTVEAHLGKPTVPAWWLDMPENGFETGALPLEEEILQDEVDLARQAFGARVRQWRAAVSLAPLDALRRSYQEAGVRIAAISCDDLATLGGVEVDFVFNLARALGPAALTTPLVIGEPRRLVPFADRHAMRVGFENTCATRRADCVAALAHSGRYAVSLDVARWLAGGQGSPLGFLRQHAQQTIQVRVAAADLVEAAPTAPVREVLLEILANGWPIPITLGCDQNLSRSFDRAAMTRAVDYCLNGLRLST